MEMIPHRLVGIETSMVLGSGLRALKTIPHMPMAVHCSKRPWFSYKSELMHVSQMLDHPIETRVRFKMMLCTLVLSLHSAEGFADFSFLFYILGQLQHMYITEEKNIPGLFENFKENLNGLSSMYVPAKQIVLPKSYSQ